jgi:coenzyme F420 hydrogenase subunit beta
MHKKIERTYLELGKDLEESPGSPLWVIPKDICTRCGACHVICPTNVVKFNETEFPFIETKGCIDCGLCVKVCPGIDFDLQEYHKKMYGIGYKLNKMSGSYRKAYVGYSTNPEIHSEGSSGGIVTQLLVSLLDMGFIDGALVVGNSKIDPLSPLPKIARTAEEIRAAAQSKYVVVANTKVFRELRNSQERIAFVGLPCQIHGLMKLEELNKQLARRVVLTIGLACRGTLEPYVVPEFLAMRGVNLQSVSKIGFRDGEFPGKIRAWLNDGSVKALHRHEFKDGAYNNLFRLYLPKRCIMCPDYSAEFSDIMCSDIWSRDEEGNYQYPRGATLVLCRTELGESIVDKVLESRAVHLDIIAAKDVERAYKRLHWEKKTLPFAYMMERKRQSKQVPDYGVTNRITTIDRFKSFLFSSTFIFGKNPYIRRIVLRILFSPPGEGLLFLKIKFKKYYSRLR